MTPRTQKKASPATVARRERQAARSIGSARVTRAIGESAPDVRPVQLPSGELLQAEVKSRRRLPGLVVRALAQAAGYARRATSRAVPCAIVFQHGEQGGIACVRLGDFARLVGLDVEQLPRATPLRRERPSPQLVLFPGAA
jgi:hypothetical protein